MTQLQAFMVVIKHLKWRNGHLKVLSEAYLAGESIQPFLECDSKWIDQMEKSYPGFKATLDTL